MSKTQKNDIINDTIPGFKCVQDRVRFVVICTSKGGKHYT